MAHADNCRTYRERHREKITKRIKIYYARNRQSILDRKRAYYQANRDKIIAASAAYKRAAKLFNLSPIATQPGEAR